ncbi:MAG: EAL domain-containing protein [Gammaproteobacteria bacterium]|nr:EAL domain-containing protein [Gammaproteobacteria bacterium]
MSMQTDRINQRSPRMLSLKWKAIILTSVVLIIITVSFSVLSYLNQVSQFREQRSIIKHRQEQELNGLIDQSLVRLQHLSELIQKLKGVPSALLAGEPPQLHSAFNRHWTDLQIQFGLDVGQIYDANNQLLAAWGRSGMPEKSDTVTSEWARQSNHDERPVTALDCKADCELYAVSPILMQGRHIGAVLLGSPLTDIVLSFKQISGADIGLIVNDDNGVADWGGKRGLPLWQAHISALTSWEQNLDLLRSVSKQYPHKRDLAEGITAEFDGRHFEVTVLPVQYSGYETQGHFVVISDITQPLANIEAAIRDNLLLGILGLVVSELLLLALVSTPMNRLRLTAETLPLLGVGEFERVRRSIRGRTRTLRFRDEVDILDETAIELSNRLESLENDVRERTRALNDRMQELREERDFIHHLLNTAQVIILTQDENQNIRMFNHYGELLSGFNRDEVVDIKTFFSFTDADDYLTDASSGLDELAQAAREQYRHESKLVCRDGSNRDIAWLHSRLGANGNGKPIVLSIGLDVTEQKQAEQRLSWMADHDSLTRLYNRRRFQKELDRALAESQRYDNEGALLFFDLDEFKYINDTSGHQAGDMLLKVVANTLSRLVRETDIVGRLGGDEFGVLISQTNEDGALKAAQKLSDALCAIHLPAGDVSFRISVSTGIALFPHHGADVQELLANADMAMYQAKEGAHDRWHLFSATDPVRERMRAHVYWKDRVEEALAEDRFVLHYQPIMDLRTNLITHVEALLRMEDKENEGQLVRPDLFIGHCERSGLIHAIDHMVMRMGIKQVIALRDAGHDIRVSINLSGRAFEDPDLLPVLSELLTLQDVNPKLVIFEITETAAVTDFVAARSLMNSIRQLGCSFALDDFGAGFSSLRYLNQLPADYVKIDGSFIRDLSNNRDKQILVQAITDVAKGFGKKTIAEFVEGSDVIRLLKSIGVDYGQGYCIGRPVCSEDLFAMLRSSEEKKTA